MQQTDNILYFSYSELVPKVITALNYNMMRQRGTLKVQGRGGNGREVMIEADSLPYKYKELAKIIVCGNMEPGEYFLKSQIINWLPKIPAKDLQAIEQFKIQKTKSDFETGEVARIDKEGLPAEAKDQYIKEVRWILLMTEGYTRHKKELKNLHIDSVDQFRSLCISIANTPANGMKFGTNLTSFSRDKIKKYQQYGIAGIVSGKWGNRCAEKVTEVSIQTLINLFAERTKPSPKKVTDAYNQIADVKGWERVTEQTVYNNLQKPEVKQAWTLGRHGFEVWKRDYEYTGTRFRATLPNALWIGDDTKVNLFYMDKGELRAHLQVYAIIDSHSGYWLGRAYAESKKNVSICADDVRNAFGDSIEKSGGYMPFQMQYDNDGANNFYDRLNTLHFPCMPYNGQSKYIERMFKKVQEQFMADDAAFTGMNIQSKTDQSKRVRVKGNKMAYATMQDAIQAQEKWFEIMNNTPGADGRTPKEKYYGTKNEEARKATDFDRFEILYEWNQEPITMTKNGIKMQHQKRDHIYDVLAGDKIDTDFYEENVRRVFRVKYNPRNMSKIALYSMEGRFITEAVNKHRIAEAVQDYRPDERKKINEVLTAKKDQVGKALRKLETAKTVSDADMIIGTDGFKYHQKKVVNQAEADMYTGHLESAGEETFIDLEAERRKRVRERKYL